jgi:hypothetical protein
MGRSPAWRPELTDGDTLDLLDESIEVDVRTPRANLPIWVVVVDGDAYVRSYRAERGAWYRRALGEGRLTLVAGGRELDFGVEPVAGEEINRRVSEAFRAKYGKRSPRSTDAMVSPEVVRTTLRLTEA